jgi:hypothetical protein
MDARGCLIACFLLVGCSASQRIAERATEIREYADEIVVATDRIDYNGEEVKQIRSNAIAIRDAVGDIHTALPNVTDRTPWWADVIRWLAIAAAGAAAVWLLTASGILGAVRAALGWIPKPKARAASLLAAAVDDSRPETTREAIAAMRAQDAEFDAAFRRALQSQSKGT